MGFCFYREWLESWINITNGIFTTKYVSLDAFCDAFFTSGIANQEKRII